MKNIILILSETLTVEALSKLGDAVRINSGAIALYTKWTTAQLRNRAPIKWKSGNPVMLVDISVADGMGWAGIPEEAEALISRALEEQHKATFDIPAFGSRGNR